MTAPTSEPSGPNSVAGSELTFEWGGDTLAGSLHHPIDHLDRPGSGGPTAAVLMLQGSGPADRD